MNEDLIATFLVFFVALVIVGAVAWYALQPAPGRRW
jgi:hypothetical protein